MQIAKIKRKKGAFIVKGKIIALCLAQAFMIMPLSYAMPSGMENIPPELQAQAKALQEQIQKQIENGQIPSTDTAQEGDKQEKDNLSTYKLVQKSRFIIHAAEKDLDNIAAVHKSDIPILSEIDFGKEFGFSDIEKNSVPNPDSIAALSAKKVSDTEKRVQIYDSYKEVITKINGILDSTDSSRFNPAKNQLAIYNRLIIPDGCVVNQYPVPVSLSVTEDMNGAAYLLFIAYNAEHDYLIQAEQYIREYVASPNHSLDQKVAVLNALKKADIGNLAKEFKDSKVKQWKEKSWSTKNVNQLAKTMLLNNPKKDEIGKAYAKFLTETNKQIENDEYSGLPDRITRAQYRELSNLDQMKYSPEKHETYRSKDHYMKRPLSELTTEKFSKKAK
jgi:hypothetical protein